MTIGELAKQSGIAASAIRYWERIGVLPRPSRANGQRRYGTEALDRIAVVHIARGCGFELEEIRRLFFGFAHGTPAGERWRRLAERKRADLRQRMERLRAMHRLLASVEKCRCLNLEECGRIARGRGEGPSAAR